MKVIETEDTENGGKIFNGNGISLRINEKAFKCTINYKHANKEKQEEVRTLINEKIFVLVRELMFVEK